MDRDDSLLEAFPRVRLGHAPTPIDTAPALSEALGVEVSIKRDDCTGLAFGGNKVRQLEFYLGEAKDNDADTILITGAIQSNFVRVAAAAARQLGMEIHIQLEERVPDVDPIYRASGNVLLDKLLGAQLHWYPPGDDEAAADASLEALAERLAADGHRPYVIHLGIESPPIGGLGYVVAANELSEQIDKQSLSFDAIVVGSGSGLTHAGLLVGLRARGVNIPVIGVCVRRGATLQHERIVRRTKEIETLIERPDAVSSPDVQVTDSVLSPGYGKLNLETHSAISMAARLEGLFLDPVYTGKTMAGLMHLVTTGEIPRGNRVLFVHTGGLPSLFGYERALCDHLDDMDPDAHSGPVFVAGDTM